MSEKYFNACLTALFLTLSACGGGGGGDDLRCDNLTPLVCEDTGGCCARGLPFACDGFCYAGPVGPCVEAETCRFDGKLAELEKFLDKSYLDSEPVNYSIE